MLGQQFGEEVAVVGARIDLPFIVDVLILMWFPTGSSFIFCIFCVSDLLHPDSGCVFLNILEQGCGVMNGDR